MTILTINCGSSTIKYQLFDNTAEQVLASGIAARTRPSEVRRAATGCSVQRRGCGAISAPRD